MDIGPVTAIRPIPSVRPSPPGFGNAADINPDLTGVFAAEFRGQQHDDSYSASRSPSRGLEDEGSETDDSLAGPDTRSEPRPAAPENSISFFA